jgi:hypothetical protein
VEEGMSTFPATVGHQLPFTAKLQAITAKMRGAAGQEYVYYHDANPLHSWELQYAVLTAAEVTTLRTFFDTMGGAWDSFTFTDPDTAVDHDCRFDGDFDVTYNADDTYSLKLNIQEFRIWT